MHCYMKDNLSLPYAEVVAAIKSQQQSKECLQGNIKETETTSQLEACAQNPNHFTPQSTILKHSKEEANVNRVYIQLNSSTFVRLPYPGSQKRRCGFSGYAKATPNIECH